MVSVDGQKWVLDFSDLTAIDAKDFRREVGFPLASVLSGGEAEDLDVYAGLVWLARRKDEPKLTFAEVAATITMNTDLGFDDEVEEDADPEA